MNSIMPCFFDAEAGHRLVQQQHARFGCQRHGDFQKPLFAVDSDQCRAVCMALQAQDW